MKIYSRTITSKIPEIQMITPLDKFIGKDYWVKVTLTEFAFDKVNYIRVTDRIGDFVDFKAIPANCIDYGSYSRAHIPSFYAFKRENYPIYKIRISDPIEIMSDAEITEVLEANDDEYRHTDMWQENME